MQKSAAYFLRKKYFYFILRILEDKLLTDVLPFFSIRSRIVYCDIIIQLMIRGTVHARWDCMYCTSCFVFICINSWMAWPQKLLFSLLVSSNWSVSRLAMQEQVDSIGHPAQRLPKVLTPEASSFLSKYLKRCVTAWLFSCLSVGLSTFLLFF